MSSVILESILVPIVGISVNSLSQGHTQEGILAVSESLEEVFAQSRRYLGAPWLQSPGLTNTIVSLVLQVERCRCKQSADRRVLDAIRAEVEAGVYDPEENMRRLRDLEEHGYHANSLIYSILKRIPDSPTPSGRPD